MNTVKHMRVSRPALAAAAVIGGTSLFGGRGKAIHAVLGGIVIASIDNGMGLQGFSAASKNIVTAIVLVAAVSGSWTFHSRPVSVA